MRFRFRTAWLVLFPIVLAVAEPPKKEAVPAEVQKVIARVNELRKMAGLDPVSYDSERSIGCAKHAKYLVAHDAEVWATTNPLNAHGEDSKHSDYTKEGDTAGKNSVISWKEYLQAVDAWYSEFFHRVPFLDPRLKTIAMGREKGTKYGNVCMLDVDSGVDRSVTWDPERVMIWPVDKQKGVGLALGWEMPSPVPLDPDGKAGYAITATFAPGVQVIAAKGTLKLANGKEVENWFSSPQRPAIAGRQVNTITLIAKDPLTANTTYQVTFEATVNDKPWTKSWSFTTGK